MQTGQNSIAPENSLPQLGQIMRLSSVFMAQLSFGCNQRVAKSMNLFVNLCRIRYRAADLLSQQRGVALSQPVAPSENVEWIPIQPVQLG